MPTDVVVVRSDDQDIIIRNGMMIGKPEYPGRSRVVPT
jgi:hypothetical protein